MRRGHKGLTLNCRLFGVTIERRSRGCVDRIGLIKATLHSFERRVVNGMY